MKKNGINLDKTMTLDILNERMPGLIEALKPQQELLAVIALANDEFRVGFQDLIDSHNFNSGTVAKKFELESQGVEKSYIDKRIENDVVAHLESGSNACKENAEKKTYFEEHSSFQAHLRKINLQTNRVEIKNVDALNVRSKSVGWYEFENPGLLVYAILIQVTGRECFLTLGDAVNGVPVIVRVEQQNSTVPVEFCEKCPIFNL